jgi:hypothetical protein
MALDSCTRRKVVSKLPGTLPAVFSEEILDAFAERVARES